MIYTSYFAQLKKIPMATVSIARKTPSFFSGIEYKKLAPDWSILKEYKETGDEKVYIEEYRRLVLSILDIKYVFYELFSLAGNPDDICLLCYESPEKFCHRHIVSQWFRDNGYDCCELSIVNKVYV